MNHSDEPQAPVSIWPIILAAGLALLLAGVVYSPIVSVIGLVLLLGALFGWTQENRVMVSQEADEEEDEEVRHG